MRRLSAGPAIGPTRIVLDTNVLISALLFEGVASQLVPFWQAGPCCLLLIRPIVEEYLRALAYPKFHLTEAEVKALLEEEILPYAETVAKYSYAGIPFIKDPHDRKFLACAKAGQADFLVTGDKILRDLKRFGQTEILTPRDFLEQISSPHS